MNRRIAKKVLKSYIYRYSFPLSGRHESLVKKAFQKLGMPVPPLQTMFGGPESVIGAAVQKDLDRALLEDAGIILKVDEASRMRGHTKDYVYLDDKVDFPGSE